MSADQKIPAAQYLRMSNEHQNYSTENQRLAIQKYADQNGFIIVATYQDNARTGITLRSRDGLRQLLQDVTNHSVSFRAIRSYRGAKFTGRRVRRSPTQPGDTGKPWVASK